MFYEWRPYVSVAARRRQAAREMDKLRKKGHPVSPVTIEGRTIARTFWGKAWCDNLESYSDFANRLPRGRRYARNGSVVDLQIAAGRITAVVSGSELYRVTVQVSPVAAPHWKSLCADSAGGIDSLVELLQGRFAQGVMERMCRQGTGLFPTPKEMKFSCSCPDWAVMCKHVAASLYGVGARLDHEPELLFRLRQVDGKDLVTQAGRDLPLSRRAPASGKVLAGGDLSQLFGLDLDEERPDENRPEPTASRPPRPGAASRAKEPGKPAPRQARKPARRRAEDAPRPKSRSATDRSRAASAPAARKAPASTAPPQQGARPSRPLRLGAEPPAAAKRVRKPRVR